MSEKWTPGPWRVVPPDESLEDEWGVCVEEDSGIGWVYIAEHVSQEESEANARLIAAAPDLFAALLEDLPLVPAHNAACHFGICAQSECLNCQRIFRKHAAIAKARGEA